jgi:hypothetical protein
MVCSYFSFECMSSRKKERTPCLINTGERYHKRGLYNGYIVNYQYKTNISGKNIWLCLLKEGVASFIFANLLCILISSKHMEQVPPGASRRWGASINV